MMNSSFPQLKSFKLHHLYMSANSMTRKWFYGVIDARNGILGVHKIPPSLETK
jgi:hypothetical protein